MTKSIHILGGTGFIGSNLAKHLRNSGHQVTVGTRPLSQQEPSDFTRVVAENEWVVHAASASTPSSSASAPIQELEMNLRTTLCLAQALQGAPHCGVIYLSSSGTLYTEAATADATELDPVAPRTYHGAAKVASEQFLRVLALQFGNPVISVRPSNVYGPGQRARTGFGIIPTTFERCRDGLPLTLWGDGSNVRDYLYVDDLSDLLARMITREAVQGFDVVNAASGSGCSLLELVATIEQVTERKLDIRFQPARSVDAKRISPCPRHALEEFAWQATTPLANGLARAWRWHLENIAG